NPYIFFQKRVIRATGKVQPDWSESWTFQVLRDGQTGPEIEVDSAQREGFGRMISVVCLMRGAQGTSAGRAIRGWLTPWWPRVAAMFKALDGEVEILPRN